MAVDQRSRAPVVAERDQSARLAHLMPQQSKVVLPRCAPRLCPVVCRGLGARVPLVLLLRSLDGGQRLDCAGGFPKGITQFPLVGR